MNESEKQFSFTRTAPSTSERAQDQIPMSYYIDSSFDAKFRGINSLHWLPWVGKDYSKAPQGKRLLIVGESHYVPKGEKPEDGYNKETWTREFIGKEGLRLPPWYVGAPTNPLIRNTERTLFDCKDPTDESRERLWRSSAFFNLVQKLLLSREGEHRPGDNEFDEGWGVFFNLIDIIKPDLCLMLGKRSCGRLGYYLANVKTEWLALQDSEFNQKEKTIHLSRNGDKLRLIFIRHPSSYFSWSKWATYVVQNMHEYTAWLRQPERGRKGGGS
jgi:hypothetical protein